MNAYRQATEIETIARAELMPWLLKTCQAVEDTAHSEFLQKTCGDWIITKLSQQYGVELKAEARYTGNLFLETWSNLPRRTLGWMYTSHADWLFYFFADTRDLYVIDFPALWQWAFGVGEKEGAIYKYAEKTQSRYNQTNLTKGRVVPIADIQAARIPIKKYSAEQRGEQARKPIKEYDGIKF